MYMTRQRPRLRRRPRQRRRHRAADQLVPRRRLDRLVLRPVHPAGQPDHDADDGGDHVSAVGRHADRAPVRPGGRRAGAPIYVDSEPGLADVATSAIVRSLNAAVPIVVERAMWWPDGNWTEAHNSAGAIVTSPTWALADGEVGGTFANQTYVLVANTSAFTAHGAGDGLLRGSGIAAGRRSTPCRPTAASTSTTATRSPQGRRFSVLIEGTGPTPSQEPQLVVERAMYSNSGNTIWAAGTDALGTPIFPSNTFTVTPNGVVPEGAGRRRRHARHHRQPRSGPGRHHRLRAGRPRHLRRPAPDPRRQPRVRRRTSDAEPVARSRRTS